MTEAPIGAERGVALRLNNVRRTFGELVVIDGLTLDVAAGEFLAILGPSGCGKSTLLRVVAGLNAPDGGTLVITPSDAKFQTAFVFQDAHLLPWLTVLENTALPLELTGVDKAERVARARACAGGSGLERRRIALPVATFGRHANACIAGSRARDRASIAAAG